MAGRLEGKVAVITGAASGIGRGTVDLFVAEGAKVIAADIQDDKGARIEEDHKGMRPLCALRCVAGRATSPMRWRRRRSISAGSTVSSTMRAPAARAMPADGVTAEGFDSVMHLHVRAALFGMKYAIPVMRAQGGGSIISTASVAGLQAGYGPVLYSIAKAAIIHMTHVDGGATRRRRISASIASAPA